jgi:hypothetical protein
MPIEQTPDPAPTPERKPPRPKGLCCPEPCLGKLKVTHTRKPCHGRR